ncbi:MAG TPA: radical SAM protein [Longilinea sp.]|nr:radical SAM protein [Longilinea sp.]
MITDLLSDCTLCPRNCHVDRTNGQKGYCRETAELVVARAALHLWEEPCISGESGSGTVFFSGCAVGCVYCQNKQIARGLTGKKITIERLSDIFLELQSQGANNINLVTPTHYVPQIIAAIDKARARGLSLPIVYNSSGYEKTETLALLEGIVDIYLPDFKYFSKEMAKKYSNCEDYYPVAAAAIKEMVRQVGEPVFRPDGMMVKGVIVRHLTLPGFLQDSKDVILYLNQTYGKQIFISIMSQYTPLANLERYPELSQMVDPADYDELIEYAISLGVENGFIQNGETAKESFIPEFDETGV